MFLFYYARIPMFFKLGDEFYFAKATKNRWRVEPVAALVK
jgi:hypothetical protein